MKLKRASTAVWNGTGLEGKGNISMQSGVLQAQPYGFNARFQSEDGKAGTNPEELLAASHAACFTMATSFALNKAGFTADELKTVATVSIEKGDAGWSVTGVHLELQGKVPGLDAAKFEELAQGAKAGCPISRALSVPISLTAKLG
jgi:osmotically inducible protein OsmC